MSLRSSPSDSHETDELIGVNTVLPSTLISRRRGKRSLCPLAVTACIEPLAKNTWNPGTSLKTSVRLVDGSALIIALLIMVTDEGEDVNGNSWRVADTTLGMRLR